MANLKAFRQYSEHDVVNLFSLTGNGITLPFNKGTLVSVNGDGWKNDASSDLDMLGDVGAAYSNTVSQRYGVPACVTVAATGDNILGVTLYDVKETDENGEKLIFNPRKAAELQAVVSGQAVPIMTKGVVLYNGVGGTPAGGGAAYAAANGIITATSGGKVIGKFLGAKDADGNVLVKIEL
jgi:hypothetical protein